MDTRPVCCQPCDALGFCQTKANCCLECHFTYEEELAAPYLPLHLRNQLRAQHEYLIAIRLPHDEVQKHAAWEEQVFRMYCPPEVCAQIERDHDLHGQGQLYSRDQTINTLAHYGLAR